MAKSLRDIFMVEVYAYLAVIGEYAPAMLVYPFIRRAPRTNIPGLLLIIIEKGLSPEV